MKTYTLERPNKATPTIYSTEEIPSEHKVVYEHYFMPGTDIDFYVLEYSQEDDVIFCWAELVSGCGELGYSSLKEMESVLRNVPVITPKGTLNLIVRIERDRHWKRMKLGEALAHRSKRV